MQYPLVDILVFERDIREHTANLKLMLGRLRDVGLTLNPKKCRFLKRSITFLGFTVLSDETALIEDYTTTTRVPLKALLRSPAHCIY